MSQLQNISPAVTIQDYAVGAFQQKTRPVGEFLAPTVPVGSIIGRYKEWSEKSRFHVPNTLRALSGAATEIAVDAADKQFDCAPNALNYRIDKSIGEDVERLTEDAVDFFADVYGLAHLYEAIYKAKQAAGNGTNVTINVGQDPVDLIDSNVETVLLTSKCEQAGVLFGAMAWRRFKNHPLVVARRLALKWETTPSLFTADAQYMGCFAVVDTAAEGLNPVMQFLLKDEILIFGRHASPSRRDPSFMKTFRYKNGVDNVKLVESTDGRNVIVKLDWSAAIQVANAAGVQRINYLAA